MDVVVNDTNIFIDLLSVELLEETFKLPIDFHTVDYVVSEIVDSYQKKCIMSLVDRGLLTVKEFNEIESYEIINMYEKRSNNVSVTDCSVWYYAKQNNYRLLTGDGKLRYSAINDGVMVSGILFITDMLVDYGIVDPITMTSELNELSCVNKRLPKKLIEEYVSKYMNMKKMS